MAAKGTPTLVPVVELWFCFPGSGVAELVGAITVLRVIIETKELAVFDERLGMLEEKLRMLEEKLRILEEKLRMLEEDEIVRLKSDEPEVDFIASDTEVVPLSPITVTGYGSSEVVRLVTQQFNRPSARPQHQLLPGCSQ